MNLTTPRMLWASLLFSNVLLLVVGTFLLSNPPITGFNPAALAPATFDLRGIIWLMAFGAVATSFVLPRVMTRPAEPSTSTTALLQRSFTPFILALALSESATMCGLLAAHLLTPPSIPELMFLPALAAMTSIALRFPTEATMRKLARARS